MWPSGQTHACFRGVPPCDITLQSLCLRPLVLLWCAPSHFWTPHLPVSAPTQPHRNASFWPKYACSNSSGDSPMFRNRNGTARFSGQDSSNGTQHEPPLFGNGNGTAQFRWRESSGRLGSLGRLNCTGGRGTRLAATAVVRRERSQKQQSVPLIKTRHVIAFIKMSVCPIALDCTGFLYTFKLARSSARFPPVDDI